MQTVGKVLRIILVALVILTCTACSGLDMLADNLKGGALQLGDDVAIGKSNVLITPYQSFDGKRTSDNSAFVATYSADVSGFNGQDILIGNTDIKKKDCREVTVCYEFDKMAGQCQLIYIGPELKKNVLAENGNGEVRVQLRAGTNYIGIAGNAYKGAIKVTIK